MDLEVEGRHALLFDDDATAAFVNSREALVPWNHDAALLIDRYDVRHLLDRIPPRPTGPLRRQRYLEDACDGISLVELDHERYQDLPPSGDEEEGLDSEVRKKTNATDSATYQAVPFSYGDNNKSVWQVNSESAEYCSVFNPPFTVPESLLSHLPPTEKLHQIMAKTAIFVSEHGGQSEIVLRVKQGDNPTFGFLMPDNHLHSYFRYLVDHPHLLKSDCIANKREDDKKRDSLAHEGGALSLLGSVYGTAEEDDASFQAETKGTELYNSAAVVVAQVSLNAEKVEPSTVAFGNKEVIKRPFVAGMKEKSSAGTKEKPLLIKKSCPGNSASIVGVNKKEGDSTHSVAIGNSQNFQKERADLKPSIIEPPSLMKRTIEKIVEFIVRNGKQFEAVLIEQDKSIGRFPFLLPGNLYHSYYLKILEEAHELKLHGKNFSDQKHDAENYGTSKKKSEGRVRDPKINETDTADVSEGGFYDPQRKEKFKMVLGGQKKDSQDQHSVLKQSGLSADEAAAVVLAATRGVSPGNTLQKKPVDDRHSSRNSGATAEEATAIVLAATRGRGPASASLDMSRDNDGRASSIGSLQGSSLKLASNGIFGIPAPVSLSASTSQSNKKDHSTASDVSVATVIAKTVALAASREADSSEAGLSKDQKLKAERLKRAKMFAALLKSGSYGISELANSVSSHDEHMEPFAAGSLQMRTDSDANTKEREGSSVPFDAEVSGVKYEARKKRCSSSRGHYEDSDEDHHKHTRKKHYSSRHRDEQKHRKSHSSSKHHDARHHNKHRSSSGDEHRHRKTSEHHNCDSSSKEEDDKRMSDKHRRKHRSLEKQVDVDHSKGPLESFPGPGEDKDILASDSRPSSESAEIPNDLRAKIRAMLLETL
ncbi:putative splicing factor 3A subunit 1 [Apostasia shenzhenica]|uniref:Putative splicing factor 3A subunit 1 n=1 Tax=Apostasia shenzhenica TaxID=1088818 RepID=A0A2I0BA78_9ASPA|nr:putative splicing factor 3A subunit 1 [Apostasia shenzhenica]